MVDTRMTFVADFVKTFYTIRNAEVGHAMVRRIVSSHIITINIIISSLLLTLGLPGSSVI